MTVYSVQWGGWDDHGRVRVTTVEELDALLDELAARRDADGLGYKVGVFAEGVRFGPFPLGVEIGLGHAERSLLFYAGPEGTALAFDPDLPAWDGEPVEFTANGEGTPFDEELRLTPEAARRAVREFVRTGRLPTCVQWEMAEDDGA